LGDKIMAKSKGGWKYNNGEIRYIKASDEEKTKNEHFIRIKKLKDPNTNKVMLEVELAINGSKENEAVANTIIGLKDLTKELMTLRDYGLMLHVHEATAIKNLIEINFNSIEEISRRTNKKELNEEELNEIVDYIARFIIKEEIEPIRVAGMTDDFYLIEVNVFNDTIEKGNFKRINLTSLKKDLAIEYTYCNKNRLDYLYKGVTKYNNNPERHTRNIAFIKSEIDSMIMLVKEELGTKEKVKTKTK
jgi:hypothetical protein